MNDVAHKSRGRLLAGSGRVSSPPRGEPQLGMGSGAKSLPRVVSVGFNKCATRALAQMFAKAGHRVVHHKLRDRWPVPRRAGAVIMANLEAGRRPFETFEDYVFYCDLMVNDGQRTFDGADAFREIMHYYPETILLLNLRDREAWIKSRLRHGHGEFARREMAARGFSDEASLTEAWRMDWDERILAVRAYMAERPKQFVEFDIDKDSPVDLAAALPEYNLNPADFHDIGNSRTRQLSPLMRRLKTEIANRRPRFFGK